MNRKFLALLLAVAMVVCMFSFVACGNTENKGDDGKKEEKVEVKVGFIFLHDENSTYDKNFMDAAKAACETMGVEYAQKTQIPESTKCYDAAVELIEVDGCNVIFADSFGHESFLIQAAKEYKDVEFCHATGTQAHTAGLDNFHNAFASIYEGRFLAGVAAGMKLNEMIDAGKIKAEEAKMGYVGAFTYAEVISGYTSFFLGAKSVCPSVTMDVQFTGSWYDEIKEKNAANALMDAGCVLISQHADSMGAPSACEERNVPNVSYNGATVEACPNTFIVSSKIDWSPYFLYMIKSTVQGTEIVDDWCGKAYEGCVVLPGINEKAAAEGTLDKLKEVAAKLKSGEIKVFDTATFTVGGQTLTTYKADVDTDDAFTPDTEAIADGYFHESEYRSAPYFDVRIDGITLLNAEY